MTRLSVVTLALIGFAGVASAQPVISSPPQPSPGDYTRERPGLQPMDQQAQSTSPYVGRREHAEAFRDEYGFRYDSRGDRIDAQGHLISPHTTTP
ncbi:MAG TPA: hypothetical protein VMI56_27665 [Reyranella sp.]|nr:hypothetical protein [Reyranella sp.]